MCRACFHIELEKWKILFHKKYHCIFATKIPKKYPEISKTLIYLCHYKECCKSFLTLKQYQTHYKRHLKNYKCNYKTCNKKFGSSWDLKMHQKTHIKSIIQCNFCPKQFINQHSFHSHLKQFHTKKPLFYCKICHQQFNR